VKSIKRHIVDKKQLPMEARIRKKSEGREDKDVNFRSYTS
jgi:hypothetical protein